MLYENDYIFRVRKMDKEWFSESDLTRFAYKTKNEVEEILTFHSDHISEEKIKIILRCMENIVKKWPSYFFSQSFFTWLIRLEIHGNKVKLCSFFYGRWISIENLDFEKDTKEAEYKKVSSNSWDYYLIELE